MGAPQGSGERCSPIQCRKVEPCCQTLRGKKPRYSFGRDIAGGARSIGAATKAAGRSIKHANAVIEADGHVLQRPATSIVIVTRQLSSRRYVQHGFEHPGYVGGIGLADGVAQANLPAA